MPIYKIVRRQKDGRLTSAFLSPDNTEFLTEFQENKATIPAVTGSWLFVFSGLQNAVEWLMERRPLENFLTLPARFIDKDGDIQDPYGELPEWVGRHKTPEYVIYRVSAPKGITIQYECASMHSDRLYWFWNKQYDLEDCQSTGIPLGLRPPPIGTVLCPELTLQYPIYSTKRGILQEEAV